MKRMSCVLGMILAMAGAAAAGNLYFQTNTLAETHGQVAEYYQSASSPITLERIVVKPGLKFVSVFAEMNYVSPDTTTSLRVLCEGIELRAQSGKGYPCVGTAQYSSFGQVTLSKPMHWIRPNMSEKVGWLFEVPEAETPFMVMVQAEENHSAKKTKATVIQQFKLARVVDGAQTVWPAFAVKNVSVKPAGGGGPVAAAGRQNITVALTAKCPDGMKSFILNTPSMTIQSGDQVYTAVGEIDRERYVPHISHAVWAERGPVELVFCFQLPTTVSAGSLRFAGRTVAEIRIPSAP